MQKINTHNKQRRKSKLSVSFRLNMMNILVFISGLISIFGAYEIQLGSTMHKLNYLHEKYNRILAAHVEVFQRGGTDLTLIKQAITDIKQQPIDCLAAAGQMEQIMMKMIGTYNAIEVCKEDIIIADTAVNAISQFEKGTIERDELKKALHIAVQNFSGSGLAFEPAVEKTVSVVFLSIIIIIAGKAVLIPLFGLLLSGGVSRDYQALAEAKASLLLEQQKNKAMREEQITALSTLVSGFAHEVNTPAGVSVTAASFMSEILATLMKEYKNQELTEEKLAIFLTTATESIRILDTNLRRASELVKNFKQVSIDKTTDDARIINLKDYLSEIIISLHPYLKRTQHIVNIDCPADLKVKTCPGSLHQVISNLITNTLLHGFDEGQKGKIDIHVHSTDKANTITYRDNGKGIAQDMIDKIYTPFVTTKKGQGGTGLGLYILQNLVKEKLGGQVTCKSTYGHGVEFTITLPT